MLFSSMIFLWVFLPFVIVGNILLSIGIKNKETGIKASKKISVSVNCNIKSGNSICI